MASLSEIEPSRDGYGRAVARWFDTALLPALGHNRLDRGRLGGGDGARSRRGIPRARQPSPSPVTVTWEAEQYRVDVAASEIARLTEARGLQGGNTLDTALALCRIGGDAGCRRQPRHGVREATAALDQLRAALEPIEPSERTTASPPPDLASLSEQASRDLARVRTRADLKRLGAIATRLGARRGRRAGRRADVDALRHLARRPAGPALSGGQCRAPARLRRAPDDRRRPRRNALADAHGDVGRRRALAPARRAAGPRRRPGSPGAASHADTIGPRISPRSTTATAAR